MSRYIDADALIRKIQEGHKFGSLTITELISECPTADVVEVVHGEWTDVIEFADVECSNCHERWDWDEALRFNFCPNCGADMRERRENGTA